MTPEQKKAHLQFMDMADRQLTKIKNAYWNDRVEKEEMLLRVDAIKKECDIFLNALNGGENGQG